ncbi:hypothetical protein GCM10023189_04010 [Nibrella saemangeumensis]|uniref:DUF541 domain-containing protein n=1 Tax=Nibrella saemangeumensis TaxID=1084526 RepID=A0ABP8MEV8_9BACT
MRLIALLISLLVMQQVYAQPGAVTADLPVNRIVVLGDAKLELPADQVQVSVTLRYTDPVDARKAYNAHKAAEQKLVQVLREFRIEEKDITYTLLNVHKNVNYYPQPGQRQEEVITEQQIIFKLKDLKRYPDLQLTLIGAGFNQFSAAFGSSKADESKVLALEKAIEVAREKAAVMAKASGRTLGGVLSVRDTEETDPVLQRQYNVTFDRVGYGTAKASAEAGLLDIPQKIIIPAQVKVTFELR